MYTADLVALVALIEQHGFCPHLYADDSRHANIWVQQTRPRAVSDLQERSSACIDDVYSWMLSNRLQL